MANPKEIAAAFVRKESARGGSALVNNGRTIYSYGNHFPIAEHAPDGSVLVRIAPFYSMTTSHHVGIVRGALAREGYEPTGEIREHAARYDRVNGPYTAPVLVTDEWEVWR